MPETEESRDAEPGRKQIYWHVVEMTTTLPVESHACYKCRRVRS